MSEAVAGKKIVYLYRVHADAATKAGSNIAFVTENGRTKSKDADSTATKDGSIRTPSALEQEITCTAIMEKDDPMIETMEDALDNDKLLDIWEANLAKPIASKADKYSGKYFQGYITELEITSNAEDMVEVSCTFGINGKGAAGEVTVSAAAAGAAEYVFTDSTKTGA